VTFFEALGLANLDRAELFLEEVFGRGLLGNTADEFDGLVGDRRGSGYGGASAAGAAPSAAAGLAAFGALAGLASASGQQRRAFSGGLRGFPSWERTFLRPCEMGWRLNFLGFGDTNGLARALAGAGVGAGALTANRAGCGGGGCHGSS